MRNKNISLFRIVGSTLCFLEDDGQKIYKMIKKALNEDRNVLISFEHVTVLTASFLNSAIGQLYGTFEEKKIQSLIKNMQYISPGDLELLRRVSEIANQYFKDLKKIQDDEQEQYSDWDILGYDGWRQDWHDPR